MTRQAIVRAVACGCIAVAAAVPFAVGSRVAAQDGNDIVTHFKYGSVGTEGTVGTSLSDLAGLAGALRR